MRNENQILPEPKAKTYIDSSDFSEECKGCPHIKKGKSKKECWYITSPKLRKFPCFFRENVQPGGFDKKYGATVNNYIKKHEPEEAQARIQKSKKARSQYQGSVESESKPPMQVIEQEKELCLVN